MPEKPDRPRLKYWCMVWSKRAPVQTSIWSLRRMIYPILIAFGHALWNAHRSAGLRPWPEMWVTIIIAVVVYFVIYAVTYAYQTLWNFIVVSPADLHAQQSQTTEGLKRELAELKASTEADKKRRAVKLSVSLKTEEKAHPILISPGQDGTGQPTHAHVTELTLMIYNHGENPVRLVACKVWKLHATEAVQDLPIHEMVRPEAPTAVNVTIPILRVICGPPPHTLASLQGKHYVRVLVSYSEGLAAEDAPPQDFELECRPWRGGTTLWLDAKEITSTQR